jgi:hypothetical protein
MKFLRSIAVAESLKNAHYAIFHKKKKRKKKRPPRLGYIHCASAQATHRLSPSPSHSHNPNPNPLNQQPLDLVLNSPDLILQLRRLVARDTSRDDGAANTARAPEGDLGGHEYVGDVLVLAEQRQVQQNLQRLGVGGHHDELADAAVERLGRFVGALLQLAVVGGLLDDVEDLLRQRGVREWEGCARVSDARARGRGRRGIPFGLRADIAEG